MLSANAPIALIPSAKSQLYRLRQSVKTSLQTIVVDSSQIDNERKALKRVLDDIYKRKSAQRQFDSHGLMENLC